MIKDKTGKVLSTNEIILKIKRRPKVVVMEFLIFIIHIVGSIPSHNIRRFFYSLAGIKIGKGSTIHMGARFYNPANIKIGEDSIIGEGVVLDGRGELSIGNHVAIASDVMIYNAEHDIHDEYFSPRIEKVTIHDYVFIGPRAIILPGITLGKGSVVAAGAVVTKDVSEFEIVGGVPAKPIGTRKHKDPQYRLGRASWFR